MNGTMAFGVLARLRRSASDRPISLTPSRWVPYGGKIAGLRRASVPPCSKDRHDKCSDPRTLFALCAFHRVSIDITLTEGIKRDSDGATHRRPGSLHCVVRVDDVIKLVHMTIAYDCLPRWQRMIRALYTEVPRLIVSQSVTSSYDRSFVWLARTNHRFPGVEAT